MPGDNPHETRCARSRLCASARIWLRVVTLTGHVDSHAEKWGAEQAAQRVSGVKAIAVDMRVKLPGTRERTDADIARAAMMPRIGRVSASGLLHGLPDAPVLHTHEREIGGSPVDAPARLAQDSFMHENMRSHT